MFLDWFTVTAQVVNFLILVWLLKRFLYRPVLRAIEEREKRIASQLRAADEKQQEARKELDQFRQKNESFGREREALLAGATSEAAAERRRLTEEARQEAEVLRGRLKEALRHERENLSRDLGNRTRQEVFAIARKALSDLAGASLEQRATEVFICRLRELNGEEKAKLTAYLQLSRHAVIVRSAFELPREQQTTVQRAITEMLGAEVQVQFETSAALVSGIELVTNGHKVAWSIDDYLGSLEKNVSEVLEMNHAGD